MHAAQTLPEPLLEPAIDPAATARAAGLRYISDRRPGITRKKTKTGFRYTTPGGAPVKDKDTLARIKSLVIPPAWTAVWISPLANGHLQATGRDVKGRKQPRYHPKWREARDETKYERMAHFADALPLIRQRVDHDLSLPGMPKNKVLATIVRLMEETHIRVGNEEYARENHSYGLTTMQHEHVEVHGSHVTFSFQGKSRVHHTIDLKDKRLAKIIHRCEEIEGHELFQYLDHDGNHHTIDSTAVNDYLRDITHQHFTAKDFRTWAGSVLATTLLSAFDPWTSAKEAKKNVAEAIKHVAERLGNTPAVCRKCYVHPAVLEHYLKAMPAGEAKAKIAEAKHEIEEEIKTHTHTLREEERALMNLLEQKLLLETAG